MEIKSFDNITEMIFERIEAGGFADPDLRLLAESVRFISMGLSKQETLREEMLERE